MQSLVHVIAGLRETSAQPSSANLSKAIADNIFQELKQSGLKDKDIVAVSSELLGMLTSEIQERHRVSVQSESNGSFRQ